MQVSSIQQFPGMHYPVWYACRYAMVGWNTRELEFKMGPEPHRGPVEAVPAGGGNLHHIPVARVATGIFADCDRLTAESGFKEE